MKYQNQTENKFDNVDDELDLLYRKAQQLFSQQAYRKTIDLCLNILSNNHDFTNAHLLIARAYLKEDTQRIKNAALAEKHLKEIYFNNQDSAEINYRLAVAIRVQGKVGESGNQDAKRYLAHAINLDSKFSYARYEYAKILFLEGEYSEAKMQLEKVIEIEPDNQLYHRELDDINEILNENKKAKLKRWPVLKKSIQDIKYAATRYILPAVKEQPPMIKKGGKVVTFGSCFAGNIARVLREKGVDAVNITIGEYVNSTYANKCFVDWVVGNSITDSNEKRMQELLDQEQGYYKQKLREAEVIIITVGVAPCFFEKKTGVFVMPRASQINLKALSQLYINRNTTVLENVENLSHIVSILRQINSSVKIVVTLSPVPLAVTFERESVIEADCVSKSILRVAVDELVTQNSSVIYWPSFEIVRWLGAYNGNAYGEEDGTTVHVSESYIETIIELFLETYASEDMRA
ncbi:MAG: GSCFA domain-containing protein [Gammaproteobacteria bacterium]|nr:GSCFA domain-containing protein [Gammaproteobacteria bacterium]